MLCGLFITFCSYFIMSCNVVLTWCVFIMMWCNNFILWCGLLWCTEVVKLCFVHLSLRNVVTLLCCLVSSLCGLITTWCGFIFVFLTSFPIPSSSNQALLAITNWLNWFLDRSQFLLFPGVKDHEMPTSMISLWKKTNILEKSWKMGKTWKSCGNTHLRLVFPQHFPFSQTSTRASI